MQSKQMFSSIKSSFPLLNWQEVPENFKGGTLWWSCSGVSNSQGLKVELYTKKKRGLVNLTLMLRATILVLVTVTVETTVEELEAQLAQLIENFKHKTNEYLTLVGLEVGSVSLLEKEK